MKILVVAKTDSIHTARWLSQITDQGWEIHVFPCTFGGVTHDQLKNVIIHDDFLRVDNRTKKVKLKLSAVVKLICVLPDLIKCKWNFKKLHVLRLRNLIENIEPDIIHAMEIQCAGYLVSSIKKSYSGKFPKWLMTIWGSDIYYFSRFPEHKNKIQEVLAGCDYFSSECNRDVCLAKDLGLTGKALPALPVTGGYNIKKIDKYRKPGNSSDRRIIMLKGYQGWAGRAMIGLRALERCADLLKGYTIKIYSIAEPDSPMPEAIEKAIKKTGLSIEIVPLSTPHDQLLKLHGQARISIGLSITDGISTSLLEAIAMGSFPVQSSTACADEWIIDGKSGFIVPPEDVDSVEQAIKKALLDDNLVNNAAKMNRKTTEKRLGEKLLKQQAIDFYQTIYNSKNK